MDNNVLIIGAGFAGCRYIEALLFEKNIEITICGFGIKGKSKEVALSKGLNYVNYNELTIGSIGCFKLIIVCVPLKVKYCVLQHVLENLLYEGLLIIEKPLSLRKKELKKYAVLLKDRNYYVGYARRFLSVYDKFPKEEKYDISIATFTDDFLYNVNHMLPHLLEWIIRTKHDFIFIERQENQIVCLIDNKKSNIRFDTRIRGVISINGEYYKNPIFLDNIMIVRVVLMKELMDTDRELLIAEKIIDVVSEITEGVI